ncbi:MAG: hypothetical protein KDD69_16260, partial [Bdellovibrionales bacterium]|nr:hypothetical protein [Bdellovibrionales bacterium]
MQLTLEELERLEQLSELCHAGKLSAEEFRASAKLILGDRELPHHLMIGSVPQLDFTTSERPSRKSLGDVERLTTCSSRSSRASHGERAQLERTLAPGYVASQLHSDQSLQQSVSLRGSATAAVQPSTVEELPERSSPVIVLTVLIMGAIMVLTVLVTKTASLTQAPENGSTMLQSTAPTFAPSGSAAGAGVFSPLFGPDAVQQCSAECSQIGAELADACHAACSRLSFEEYARRILPRDPSAVRDAGMVKGRCAARGDATARSSTDGTQAAVDALLSSRNLAFEHQYTTLRLAYEQFQPDGPQLSALRSVLCLRAHLALGELGARSATAQADAISRRYFEAFKAALSPHAQQLEGEVLARVGSTSAKKQGPT